MWAGGVVGFGWVVLMCSDSGVGRLCADSEGRSWGVRCGWCNW